MQLPKVIALLSTQGDQTGFMLLAPDATGTSGDCVFMLSPSDLAGIESDMGIVVSELKVAGEHRFNATAQDGGITLVVTPVGLPQVDMLLNSQFSGRVHTDFCGTVKCIGSAEPLPGSA